MKPSKAVLALIQAGHSETSIARAVGTSQSTVNRVKHGMRPRFELGMALIGMAEAPDSVAIESRSVTRQIAEQRS